jgi:hypothetical protein
LVVGGHPVDSRTTDTERRRDRAGGLAAGVHPLRQTRFLRVERLGPSDVLPACPTCLTRRCPAFPAKLQFKFGQAREHPGDHAVTGDRNNDGSITVRFVASADGDIPPNAIVTPEGWNYLIRFYRPRAEVLDGSWTPPTLTPCKAS